MFPNNNLNLISTKFATEIYHEDSCLELEVVVLTIKNLLVTKNMKLIRWFLHQLSWDMHTN